VTTSQTVHSASTQPKALLPWLASIAAHQWKAWKAARRAARADELTWSMALQEARLLAKQSRQMSQTAEKR